MKLEDVTAVYMPVGESAGLVGNVIVEVFTKKEDANKFADKLKEKIKDKWGWKDKELTDSDVHSLNYTVQVMPLSDAIDRIEDEIHEEYASQHPEY